MEGVLRLYSCLWSLLDVWCSKILEHTLDNSWVRTACC